MKNFILIAVLAIFSFQGCSGDANGAGDGSIAGGRSADGEAVLNEQKGVASPAPPKIEAGQEVDSVYTDLDPAKCKTIELNEEEGGWSVQRCKGAFGYDLEVTEGDLRQTIIVIDPSGKRSDLELVSVVSGGFSMVGKKAEWRFRTENGKKTPFALIVRFEANEDPSNPEKVTSYLTVSKITEDAVCVTDIVKPIKNANERARELALESANKPCLKAK
jgi:hypothetical protein